MGVRKVIKNVSQSLYISDCFKQTVSGTIFKLLWCNSADFSVDFQISVGIATILVVFKELKQLNN